MVTQETTRHVDTIHEIAGHRFYFFGFLFLFLHFIFHICCLPDWGKHVDMPHPVDVDGGAEVEVGLDGGGDLGEKWHPVLLVPATNFFSELKKEDEKFIWFPQSGWLSVKICLVGVGAAKCKKWYLTPTTSCQPAAKSENKTFHRLSLKVFLQL